VNIQGHFRRNLHN